MTGKRKNKISTSLEQISEMEFSWKIENVDELLNLETEMKSSKFYLHSIPDSYIVLTFSVQECKTNIYFKYCHNCGSTSNVASTHDYHVGLKFYGELPLRNILYVNISMNNEEIVLSTESEIFDKYKEMSTMFIQPLYKEIDINCSIGHYEWEIHANKRNRTAISSLHILDNKCKQTNHFHENLEKLYNNPILADVIIYVDGRKYETHKIILATNSPVFKSMFTHGLKETRENIIYIEEICPNIFEIFLCYMYTEKIRLNDKEEALDLIIVADRYGVNDLKTKCLDIITSIMNVNNIITILNISYLINDESLKIKAFKYVANNLKKVKATENYEKFSISNPHALVELYEYTLLGNSC